MKRPLWPRRLRFERDRRRYARGRRNGRACSVRRRSASGWWPRWRSAAADAAAKFRSRRRRARRLSRRVAVKSAASPASGSSAITMATPRDFSASSQAHSASTGRGTRSTIRRSIGRPRQSSPGRRTRRRWSAAKSVWMNSADAVRPLLPAVRRAASASANPRAVPNCAGAAGASSCRAPQAARRPGRHRPRAGRAAAVLPRQGKNPCLYGWLRAPAGDG